MRSELVMLFLLMGVSFEECSIGCLRCSVMNNECMLCDTTGNFIHIGKKCLANPNTDCRLIAQSNRCLSCRAHFYIDWNTGYCIPVDTQNLVENCNHYNEHQFCTACFGEFVLSNNLCTSLATNIPNCKLFLRGGSCSVCHSGHLPSFDHFSCICISLEDNFLDLIFLGRKKGAQKFAKKKTPQITRFENLKFLQNMFSTQKNFIFDKFLSTSVCQKAPIYYCNVFFDFKKCKKCITGYYLSRGICLQVPLSVIPQCHRYSSLTTCIECRLGYFLNDNLCFLNIDIKFCKIYSGSSSVTTCLECNEGFFLNNNVCRPRSSFPDLKECSRYSKIEDLCDSCNHGFMIDPEGKKCYPETLNCKSYELRSNDGGLNMACFLCKDGFYLDLASSKPRCIIGTVPNCRVFDSSETKCNICENGYYLSKDTCMKHTEIEHCFAYNQTVKNSCSVCAAGYFSFVYTFVCVSVEVISKCKTHSPSGDGCKKCFEGFYLAQGQCHQNPALFSNCLVFAGTECIFCKKGYMVNALPTEEVCIPTFNYVISKSKSKCYALKTLSEKIIPTWMNPVPFSTLSGSIISETCGDYMYGYAPLRSEAICILTSQLNFYDGFITIDHCKRYGLNYSDFPSIVCMECDLGFYIIGYDTLAYKGTAYSETNPSGILCSNNSLLHGYDANGTIIPDDMMGFVNIFLPYVSTPAASTPFLFSSFCRRAGRNNGARLKTPVSLNTDSFSISVNAHSDDFFCFIAAGSLSSQVSHYSNHQLVWNLPFSAEAITFNKSNATIPLRRVSDFSTGYSGVVDQTSLTPNVFNFNGILASISPQDMSAMTKTPFILANCNIYAAIQSQDSDGSPYGFMGPSVVGLNVISKILYVPMGDNAERKGFNDVPGSIIAGRASISHFCLRCNMGYELKYIVSGFSVQNWPKPFCVGMTNCASKTTVYGGLPTFLNSVFSCHVCNPSARSQTFPSIYIETDGIGDVGATGQMLAWAVAKMYTSPSTVRPEHGFRCAVAPSAVRTNDDPHFSNLSAKQLIAVSSCAAYAYIQPVGVAGEPGNLGNPPTKRSAILSSTPGTFGITTSMAGISYSDYGIPICVACAGNHFPTYYDPMENGTVLTNGAARLPAWAVTKCSLGADCNSIETQFNSCAGCRTDMETVFEPEYYAFSDFTISNCYRTTTANCFMLSASDFSATSTSNPCEVCKAGFFKNADGYCESYTIPNQSRPNGIFSHSYFASKAFTTGFSNLTKYEVKISYLLSYKKPQYGVDSCENGYTRAPAHQWTSKVCVFSLHIYFNVINFTESSKFVKNCLNYGLHESNGNYLCQNCISGYLPTSDGLTCIECEKVQNCLYTQSKTNCDLCHQCEPNFYNIDGTCLNGSIFHCLVYQNDQFAQKNLKKLACKVCEDGFCLLTSKFTCVPGGVQNCKEYRPDSVEKCIECFSGYFLVDLDSGLTNCHPLEPSHNREISRNTDKSYPNDLDPINLFRRKRVSANDFWENSWTVVGTSGATRSVHLPSMNIENCIIYDQEEINIIHGSFACKKCAEGYFYSIIKNKCKKRQNILDACAIYSNTSDDCETCVFGSFLSDDRLNCLEFPTGIFHCSHYDDQTGCIKCNIGYTLKNKQCVVANEIPNCLNYDSLLKCAICDSGTILDETGRSCIDKSLNNLHAQVFSEIPIQSSSTFAVPLLSHFSNKENYESHSVNVDDSVNTSFKAFNRKKYRNRKLYVYLKKKGVYALIKNFSSADFKVSESSKANSKKPYKKSNKRRFKKFRKNIMNIQVRDIIRKHANTITEKLMKSTSRNP